MTARRRSPLSRSEIMSRIRGKDTKPEMVVRRALHAHGFRFRLHRRDLPGTPDIVLPRWRTVVEVRGCYWHGHRCQKRVPKTNTSYWLPKIERNRERDAENEAALRALGWYVIIIWGCALTGKGRWPAEKLIDAVADSIASGRNRQFEGHLD